MFFLDLFDRIQIVRDEIKEVGLRHAEVEDAQNEQLHHSYRVAQVVETISRVGAGFEGRKIQIFKTS